MKQKISRFEFAIMETISPEEAKNFEPRTEQEEINLRQQNLLNQVKNLVISDKAGQSEQLPSCECDNVEVFYGWGNQKCFSCKDCGRTW